MLMIERRPGSSIATGDRIRIHGREIERRDRLRLGVKPPRSPLPADHCAMVAEDAPDHLEMIRRALAAADVARVSPVRNVADAAVRGANDDAAMPDLLPLDPGLPDRSGREVLQRIRGRIGRRRTPIVILSSSAEDENPDRCLECGAPAFVAERTGYAACEDPIVRTAEFRSRTRRVA